MDIHMLRKRAGREEIDYSFLMYALKEYEQPRNKIQRFLQSGELIRIKKGLYAFGANAAQIPYSKEILANLIYGPSALSLEYALAYYGLIPERVTVMTSITNNRNKQFRTPIGQFDYYYISPKKYSVGITQIEIDPQRHFLMATKEKALIDVLTLKTEPLKSQKIMAEHLFDNLRIDEEGLKTFDLKGIAKLFSVYSHKNVQLLLNFLGSDYG